MANAKTMNRYNAEGRKALKKAYQALEHAHGWFKQAAHESGTDAPATLSSKTDQMLDDLWKLNQAASRVHFDEGR
ncbi:MAG: hypothetical protein ACRD1X_10205 [Vicinamibacteria bacterium]